MTCRNFSTAVAPTVSLSAVGKRPETRHHERCSSSLGSPIDHSSRARRRYSDNGVALPFRASTVVVRSTTPLALWAVSRPPYMSSTQ